MTSERRGITPQMTPSRADRVRVRYVEGASRLAAWTAVAIAALVCCAPAGATVFHPEAGASDNGYVMDGHCTLREAIVSSNTDAPSGGGDCPAGAGTDEIDLSGGTYDLALAGASENGNLTGDLDITDNVAIVGAGSGATTINAHSIDRIFDIQGGVTISISGTTLTGGKAPNGADGPATPAGT